MTFSEIPPPPEVHPGQDAPLLRCRPPGPHSRTWLTRWATASAPMGPERRARARGRIQADVPASTIVYATAKGSNVLDVDGNRYVDLAAGFGALLLGHGHPSVQRVLELQASRLMMALGDVHPADAKIALSERLSRLFPEPGARVILGQSGADALTAAFKTAVLATGRPGVLAFRGGYHGLGYAPLAACGLRDSYRLPFAEQLNPEVVFVDYPTKTEELDAVLESARRALAAGRIGAVVVEPVLGRGGCVVPPTSFLRELGALAREAGALVIADEVWTGLGRAGRWLAADFVPDLVCLGKGLGGGLPLSACIGSGAVMAAWRRDEEVVHTSTFAGAPLACATAIATLDALERQRLVERSAEVGARWLAALREALAGRAEVRGVGLMVGIDVGARPGAAVRAGQLLLERGYIVSSGGGAREVLVLTPPLNIAEDLLDGFVAPLRQSVEILR